MPLSGTETIAEVRRHQREVMLAFSCGKDAIAAWLAIRPSFDRIVPFYLYLVPGLEFVEESLQYYERFFGTPILRLPHPSLHRMLNNLTFQAPQNCRVIEDASLQDFTYTDMCEAIAEHAGLPDGTLHATGVRAADSPMRRIAIMTHGAISWTQRKFHPVWDWRKKDLIDAFHKARIRLPIDYRLFGRTFDGIDLRFLLPIKKNFPRDYARILEFFPLAEAEVKRWEYANAG